MYNDEQGTTRTPSIRAGDYQNPKQAKQWNYNFDSLIRSRKTYNSEQSISGYLNINSITTEI